MEKNKQTISFSVYLSLKELTKQLSGNDKGRKPVLNDFFDAQHRKQATNFPEN